MLMRAGRLARYIAQRFSPRVCTCLQFFEPLCWAIAAGLCSSGTCDKSLKHFEHSNLPPFSCCSVRCRLGDLLAAASTSGAGFCTGFCRGRSCSSILSFSRALRICCRSVGTRSAVTIARGFGFVTLTYCNAGHQHKVTGMDQSAQCVRAPHRPYQAQMARRIAIASVLCLVLCGHRRSKLQSSIQTLAGDLLPETASLGAWNAWMPSAFRSWLFRSMFLRRWISMGASAG